MSMKKQKTSRQRMHRCLAVCGAALLLSLGVGGGLVLYDRAVARQQALEAWQAAEEAAAREAAEKAAKEAEDAARAASEAARQEEERLQAEQAAARRSQQLEAAAAARETVQYGDKLGTIRVEGTQIDCNLYWGDDTPQFDAGAGCRAEADCVLPGENGTVFIGAHTGTFFADLGSAEIGDRIYLDTDWGNFVYEITETQVIYETDTDKVRWGAEEPSCILYTCYPFGILTHTDRRYAVYADPVEADENGVIPQEADH